MRTLRSIQLISFKLIESQTFGNLERFGSNSFLRKISLIMSSKTNLMTFGGSQYNYFTASPHIEHLKTSPQIKCQPVFQEVLLLQSTPNTFSPMSNNAWCFSWKGG